ncbi:MAG: type III pantothenate kinase [Proteobacteria bacterium]|nr:type III pantothenate kinase [Pseudomonadota bacterium]
MFRLLALDIGNTRLSAGRFDDSQLLWRRDFAPELLPDLFSDFDQAAVDLCLVSDVRKDAALKCVIEEFSKNVRVSFVSHEKLPLKIRYDSPQALGQDRIANAMGARQYAPRHAVVVDFGTAIHFDILDGEGAFCGGPILPGIDLMLSALMQRMPHLRISPLDAKHLSPLATNTSDAVHSGILLCILGGIERILKEIRTSLGVWPCVLLTGGQAGWFADRLAHDHWVPNLTLEGLCQIAQWHAGAQHARPVQ